MQFDVVREDICRGGHVHYWLQGGRGSGKSSFVSLEVVRGVMEGDFDNAVVIRKVGSTLRQSVYEQVGWAIEELGALEDWRMGVSPMEAEYIVHQKSKDGIAEGESWGRGGGRIIFRGADEPKKLRSVRFKRGYCRYIWFEEVDEFGGIAEIRSILQSLMRGGGRFCVFYTFNPPRSRRHWLNRHLDALQGDESAMLHHSTYEGVPVQWLGEQFVLEAQRLREANPLAYAHEYMGEVVGDEGEVFGNVEVRRIGDDEIASFERVWEGVDWGYATDPFAWVRVHYDRTRRVVYIFDEVVGTKISNREAVERIVASRGDFFGDVVLVADSAEPKSIAEVNALGLKARPARKGAGSLAVGMKFLTCDAERIVVDPVRCPVATAEFTEYTYTGDGGYSGYNNHTIDAVRYALESEMGAHKKPMGVVRAVL